MLLWNEASQIPAGYGPCAVTLGNFDGVHRGHQAVLARVVERAKQLGGKAVAVTFDPHPAAVHAPGQAPEAIASLDQRLALLEAAGLDAVWVVAYTPAFAAQSPEAFVRTYFVQALRAACVVVGRDVRFGAGNSGDLGTLQELGARFGFAVEAVDDLGEGAGGARPRWSSTGLRHLIGDGDVDEAALVLGRPHRVTGTVVHGDARGRTLGYPTANLGGRLEGMVPADGVYAGWMTVLGPAGPDERTGPGAPAGPTYPVVVSIGTNPTFDGTERRVEAHVPDRDDLDLYGARVAVDFTVRLRRTLRFATREALVAQMHDDVAAAKAVLRAHPRR